MANKDFHVVDLLIN